MITTNFDYFSCLCVYRCFPDWDDICKTLDMNAHIPKPVAEEKEVKSKDEEKKAEKEGDKIVDGDKVSIVKLLNIVRHFLRHARKVRNADYDVELSGAFS